MSLNQFISKFHVNKKIDGYKAKNNISNHFVNYQILSFRSDIAIAYFKTTPNLSKVMIFKDLRNKTFYYGNSFINSSIRSLKAETFFPF